MSYPQLPYTFDEYSEGASDTAVYNGRGTVDGLIYATLGLAGEAGEIANQVKKINRDDQGVLTEERRRKLIDEASDVMWYIAAVADELRIPLAHLAEFNIDKLKERKAKNTMSADIYNHRSELEQGNEPLKPALPEFEGNKVARTKAQFTSTSNLEVEDEVYRLDDVKRFYVEAKVVNIHHKVNEKTGELDRVQVLKVVDVQPVTWNDPNGWKA
ncbi:MAG: hypothetical protein EOO70_06220 [Myxococcaceae bacterium]|nr:MAG: hypothetical protein EOO70_06220 [Myxococcaceae bacterium]